MNFIATVQGIIVGHTFSGSRRIRVSNCLFCRCFCAVLRA